jgi:AAA family ATP:ADP antiporter
MLSVFADVRAGEGPSALLLMANVFLLLAGYYLLKPARDTLIVTEFGLGYKAMASAAQAVLLVAAVPLYGWLGTRVRRLRLLGTMAGVFAANLGMFYLGGQAGLRLGVAFFVWLGIYNVFVISQFWAFANDIYTEGQGRRLFPLVGVGASLGAWIGAETVEPLIATLDYTPYTLMLLGAVVLLLAFGLTVVVDRRESGRGAAPEAARVAEEPLGPEGGFRLVLGDRYLTWIAALIILLNVVNTLGGYLIDMLVLQEADLRFGTDASGDAYQAFVGGFYGVFYARVNLIGFLLQLFVASRALRYFGVRGSLFLLPVLALVNYSVIAVVPLLAVVRVGKILENATDYSINNTVRQALFLPTSREAKYKAKAVIDTIGTRFGDVLAAAVLLGGLAIGTGLAGFAWLNVGLTALWLGVAGRIAREHRRKTD